MEYLDDIVGTATSPSDTRIVLNCAKWWDEFKMLPGVKFEEASIELLCGWGSVGVVWNDYMPEDKALVYGPNGMRVLDLGKEPKMATNQTWAYEVLIPEEKDEAGDVVREAVLIDQKLDCLTKPTRESVLWLYKEKLTEHNIGADDLGKVVVNIRPFLG